MANSIISPKYIIKIKNFNPQSCTAGSYTSYFDPDIINKPVVGFRVSGVASYNMSVTTCISNLSGLNLVIKNNGSTNFTPSAVEVYYLD